MSTIEKAVNYYQTRVHYTTDLEPREVWHGPGRWGSSLCSTSAVNRVEVYDREARQHEADRYGAPVKAFEDLPLCKKCERKAAKITGEGS